MTIPHPKTIYGEKPGHFTKRDVSFFNDRNGKLLKLLTGSNVLPTEKHYNDYARMTLEGDPLADAVVEWFREVSFVKGRAILDRALDEGIDAIEDAPQCLVDLFAQIDKEPFWLDRKLLDEGAQAIHRAGPLAVFILGDLALMGGYAISAVMNKSLVFTGALENGAEGRLKETAKWWLDMTAPKGLERNGPGFKSATKVRVMHAFVRARLLNHPQWDFDELGMPISQAHMLSTNMAFASLYIHASMVLGVRYTKRERKAIMHLWRYASMLNGIDEGYGFESETEGMRVLWLSATSQPASDEDTVSLAKSLLEVDPFGIPEGSRAAIAMKHVRSMRLGLTRMLGKQIYDELQLPKGEAYVWSPLAIRGVMSGLELGRSLLPRGKTVQARLGRRVQEVMFGIGEQEEAKFKPVETLKKDMPHEAGMAAE